MNVPVHTFFPEYEALFDEEKRRITVEHLLTMTAGWAWNENTEWGVSSNDMYGLNVASDPFAYLIGKEMADDPGVKWVYNGGAVTLLGKLIEKASELDMVVVFTGGNYESWDPVDTIMEMHILPAVGL